MTDDNMAFLERLQKKGGGDFLKELAEAVLDRLMQLDVEGLIGARACRREDPKDAQRHVSVITPVVTNAVMVGRRIAMARHLRNMGGGVGRRRICTR
jgi:hypothetical protein